MGDPARKTIHVDLPGPSAGRRVENPCFPALRGHETRECRAKRWRGRLTDLACGARPVGVGGGLPVLPVPSSPPHDMHVGVGRQGWSALIVSIALPYAFLGEAGWTRNDDVVPGPVTEVTRWATPSSATQLPG